MILAMDILRWLTVRAILDATWAGSNVHDSPAAPTEIRVTENPSPFVAVYTDDADVPIETLGDDITDNSIAGSMPRVYLLIEVGVAEPQTIEDPGENQPQDTDADAAEPAVQLSHTDQALEANIGFLARQVNQALLATGNPWAELWRRLVVKRSSVEIRRGGSGQQVANQPAVRYASRIMRYTLEVLAEPVYGEQPTGFWADLIAAFKADSKLAGLGELIEGNFNPVGAPALPSWRIAQKHLTLTELGVRSLGIAPVVIPDETEAPLGEKGTVADYDTGEPLGVTTKDDPEPLV
jgi:hypothetical protein